MPNRLAAFLAALFMAASTASGRAGPYEDAEAAHLAGDDAKSVKLLTPLAEAGDVRAQAVLGYYYDEGIGVAADKTKAVQYYRKAAEQGHSDAEGNLCLALMQGSGIAKDIKEGGRWCLEAAKHDNPAAHLNLGNWYSTGDNGFPKDNLKAYMHYQLALKHGGGPPDIQEIANYHIAYFRRALSDADLVKSERMAASWPQVP